MENGESYTRQPETTPQPTQTPETKTGAEKPQEQTEQLLAQISEQVDIEEGQTPTAEIDHRAQEPDEVVDLTVAPKTKLSPKISIPEAKESFQRQFKQDEGEATQRVINALEQLQKAA